MYPASTAYKNAIAQPSRSFKAKIALTNRQVETISKALAFDGVGDYVEAAVTGLAMPLDIEFDIKVDTIPSSNSIIFVHALTGAGCGFYNSNSFILRSGPVKKRLCDLSNFKAGAWNNVKIFYDSDGNPSVLINGKEPNYLSEIQWAETSTDLLIGKRSSGNYCKMEMSSFRIIKDGVDYLRYDFDEGSGSIAHDSAGDNHGTIYGASRVDSVVLEDQCYHDENIVEITLDETVNPSDSFALGSSPAAKLELTMIGIDDDTILEGAVVEPHIGIDIGEGLVEYIPLGVFTVDDISKVKTKTKLTCFDNMIKLERPYFSDLTYPAKLSAVAQEIADKGGVTLATVLPDTLVRELEGYTLREAIGFVAAFMGGFARFNRSGELEIATYQATDVGITPDDYIEFKTAEKPFTIGRLTCFAGYEEGEEGEEVPITLSAGDSGNEIRFECPIMTQEQLDGICAVLSQLSYMPFDLRWQGNPALMAGDAVTITDTEGNTFATLIMEQQLRYAGGLTATAEAKGKTEQAQEFQTAGPMTRRMERYTTDLANVKVLLADKANIGDLSAIDAKIENLVVDTAQIADGAITNAKIKNAEITGAKIKHGEIETAHIQTGAITTALIEEGAIETAQIADGSITDAKIVGLTANKITAGKIDAAEIEVVNLKAANITVGTINGQQISEGAIEADHIESGAITNAKIAPGAITGDKIQAGSIKEAAMNWTMHLLF